MALIEGERFNSITHIVGAALAAVSGTLLVAIGIHDGDVWKVTSFSVYAVTLFVLYVTSSLYHTARGTAKKLLRKMDHCAIYLLIAGSYTPFTLVTLRGALGWSILSIVWAMALLGIAQELCHAKGSRALSLVIYIMMGWLAIVGVEPLIVALGADGFAWLLAGGLFYTIGIVFYATDGKVRHGHGIWHLFVLGGSVCHYVTVLFYVA